MVEMELVRDIGKWSKKINELNSSVSGANWAEFDRNIFVNTLEEKLSELENMLFLLQKIQEEIEKQPEINAPDFSEITGEFSKTMQLLKRNLELEHGKTGRAEKTSLSGKENNAELYSSLQQKILELVLKTRHLNERLVIFSKKKSSSPIQEKSTGKKLLELLEQREMELQELKGKYEGVRKHAYLGLIEERTAHDLESDVTGLDKTLAKQYSLFEQNIIDAGRQIESLQNSLLSARERFSEIKDVLEEYSAKNSEFAKVLKKERDYAKKIVLDRENETMGLRSAYSREVLNLQEAKLAAKREAEQSLGKQLKSVKNELAEKTELLHKFKNIAEDKLKKEQKLEEQLKDLKLLLKAKQKHDSVKAGMAGKKKQ